MPDIDRNKFRKYTPEEVSEHILDGKNVIEYLKKIRGIDFMLSIGAANTLTRVQGYVESAQALVQRVPASVRLSKAYLGYIECTPENEEAAKLELENALDEYRASVKEPEEKVGV